MQDNQDNLNRNDMNSDNNEYNSSKNANAQTSNKEKDLGQYETAEDDDANQDIFADGILEEFEEKFIKPKPSMDNDKKQSYATQIEPIRKQPLKLIIVKQRKEFGAPITFYDKEPGAEGNSDIKQAPKAHECPTMPRSILEIGFQTKFSISKYNRNPKIFQVQSIRKVNAFTQVYDDNADIKGVFQERANEYLKSEKKDTTTGKTYMQKIEQFIDIVRPKVEEALQSNETIDIFQNDFQLDRYGDLDAIDSKTKKTTSNESEVRMFRDNMLAGQKSKREKGVNCIKLVKSNLEYIAHSLLRNLTFEERCKVIGIPYTGQILFWNFKDPEVNSPVFVLDLPMEVTCFEFNPINMNILVCSLFSGQLIIFEFEKLLYILQNGIEADYMEKVVKTGKHELYNFYITGIAESHKTHINAMKWLPKGFSYYKYQLNYNENLQEINLLATVAEDGLVCIWDILHLDKTIKNEVSNYIKPVLRVEVNRLDSLLKICGTSLELKLKANEQYIYVGTDDGQVYTLDWREKVTPENLTGNLKKIYNPCYFRPVLSMEFSPFFEDIFMILQDFSFSIWNTEYTTRPILISPNLKSCFYISGKFSKSRPGVLFFARNTGQIDIWDLLDESHKPSVKETFLKETIMFIDLILYMPVIEDENLNKRTLVEEYLCIGDQAGQLAMMAIPKLFTELVPDEKEIIKKFLKNELDRQRYMDSRYKLLEEEYNKPPDEIELIINPPAKEKGKEEIKEETEWKYLEDAFISERTKIIEEYGFTDEGNKIEDFEDDII